MRCRWPAVFLVSVVMIATTLIPSASAQNPDYFLEITDAFGEVGDQVDLQVLLDNGKRDEWIARVDLELEGGTDA